MDCAAKFEKEVAAIPGVTRAELNFGASKLTVQGAFDPQAVYLAGTRHDIVARPAYEKGQEKQSFFAEYKRVIISGLAGCALLSGWVLQHTQGLTSAAILLYIAAMVIGGFSTARKAFFSIRKLNFDMNVLMTIAVIGAAAIGEWSEGASVAFLYSISNALESFTMEKARQSIRELMDIAPREALVRRNGEEICLAVDEIRVGDILIVKPGAKIAMDGKVIKGTSAVNQAAITGESVPVEKNVGDEVFAGTLNQEGAIEVEVTKLVNDTTIAKIIHMVEEAQAQRAPSQKFIDRFAAVYTPIVIALAIGVVLIPPLVFGRPWSPWIYRGLALLVVSCPCALVVSTPVALVSAIGNAARNGVLIKGGVHLEEMGSVAVIAFDKTGTLTVGRPAVIDIIPVTAKDEKQVLNLAASIEQFSEHPLAKAIVEKARQEKLALLPVEDFTSLTGKGARAKVKGKRYFIGNPRLLDELGMQTKETGQVVAQLQEQGKTVMVVGDEENIVGIIAVADIVRESAARTIRELKQAGLRRAVMLTGDNKATAKAIAEKAGIDEFHAELLPQDKVAAVNNLVNKFGKVAMVGDGINDAPALAAATVGIAMGGAGTDTALETADIALMADDLAKLPFLVRLSRATLSVIKQNIYFAVVIKLIAVVLIFPGWLMLWMAILADTGAAVLVTLNAIRLLRIKPELY
ncbi:heavy metal translocating P-type ATPase [Thermincola potens JR]|uniref:Cd(2+)-exporting ATPase n=2 Tax=Thermincola TaxID=278993 RepID=D5XB06_THEPJ|nr:heavy metal translocating P-type ATPase [Thermincola potens JR]